MLTFIQSFSIMIMYRRYAKHINSRKENSLWHD